ncbi:hypothetical protein [uncultured Duodenibacillus sp.]|uniref:hypothetical protein n=1 Tax=uncultured Duodenibacillus sp. TaxID=1980699 RepID=UPI00206B9C27|nr:hypothetical protein [uncultured Duodenibacillus sp.]DAU86527.1 MAG TPA: hypothetical protein [Caudoviricetes sp.]
MTLMNFDKRLLITALLKRIESCPMERETLELTFAKYEEASKQLKAEEEAKKRLELLRYTKEKEE